MENYFENTKAQNQQILDELVAKAPSIEAANVLKWYDIAKSADINLKKIQESCKSNLEITAKYLKIDFDNAKKPELALMVLERLATLFLEPCRLCSNYYNVGLDVTPLLKCYFCGQGCHNDCYKTHQQCNNNGLFFICLSCESEEIKNKQLSKKKSKPVDTVAASTQTVPVIDNTPPITAPKKTMQERSYGKICDQFMLNTCPYGISGKGCEFYHPKICRSYVRFGPHGKRGCNKGASCDYFHPKLCNKSLKPISQRVCANLSCPFFHLPRTKRHVPSYHKINSQHDSGGQLNSQVETNNSRSNAFQPGSEKVIHDSAQQRSSHKVLTDPFLGNLIRNLVKESLQMEIASFHNMAPTLAPYSPQGPPFLPGMSHFSQPFNQVPQTILGARQPQSQLSQQVGQ